MAAATFRRFPSPPLHPSPILSAAAASSSASARPFPPASCLPLLDLARCRQPGITKRPAAKASAGSIPVVLWPRLCLQELHLDDKEADALLRSHPELELVSPESLRARILSLQNVGISSVALHQTVLRCPEILTSDEYGEFLRFVEEVLPGLRPRKLERLLVTTHPKFFTSIAGGVNLLLEHGVPAQKLGHVLNALDVRKVFCDRSLEELEEMVVFLEGFRGPELIVRRPMLLNMDLRTQLIPRVEFLTELAGGDEEAAALLIRKLPALLSYTVEHFQSHVEFWRSIGLADSEVFKIAQVYPNVFSVSRDRKLKPRTEFLMQCGLDAEDIFKFMTKSPLFISLSFEDNLSKKLAFLVKLGYRHRTRELALAFGASTRTSCENMQMVLGLFFSYGLSCEDVFAMSRKHPQVLQYSYGSLRKKMEFLIEDMEREVGEILVFPAFLGYKLDDRIKKRYEMKKDVRGKDMSLNKLLSVSTAKFYLGKSSTQMESL